MPRKYNLFGIFARTDNIIQRLTFDLDHKTDYKLYSAEDRNIEPNMKTTDYINDDNSRYQFPDISPRYVTPDSTWSSEYADLTITTKADPPIAEVSLARFFFLN